MSCLVQGVGPREARPCPRRGPWGTRVGMGLEPRGPAKVFPVLLTQQVPASPGPYWQDSAGLLAAGEAAARGVSRLGSDRCRAPSGVGWGPEAGALLTGSRSRHSGFSWQRAKRTHRWATVRARGGAQGSTTSRRGLVLSLLGTRLAWDQRVRRAFSDPRAGPAPSRTFPKPTPGVRRR